VDDTGLRAPASQLEALREIPGEDLLVSPDLLEAVLEEPDEGGGVSQLALAGWTIASLAATVGAGIWWAIAH
jgi:hypothetical protein